MITDLIVILNWFLTGSKPTQAQFWATLNSFWHKNESIPIGKIEGLQDQLDQKQNTGALVRGEVKLQGYWVDTSDNAAEDINTIKVGNPIRGKSNLFNGEFIFGEAKNDVNGVLTENDIKIYTRWK